VRYDEPDAPLDADRNEPMQALVTLPGTAANALTVDEWAARITARWQDSVEAILDVGQMLVEAKAQVGHGSWLELVGKLPFSERTAERLMAIGLNPLMQNPTHVSALPPSWGTLYALTRLSPEQFEGGLVAGVIRPDMRRMDVEKLLRATAPNLVKPSDSWNFSQFVYPRLASNTDQHGYLLGEVYANALFYWSNPGDVVVAPMAGSGMVLHVYDDRRRWMGKEPWDLDLRAFDLTPRGEYADRIAQRDALESIEGPADLIIADIPYFGQCRGRYYSKSSRNMANMDWPAYQDALARLARSCRKAQQVGSRTVIIAAAAFDDDKARRRELIMLHIVDAFRRAGYEAADIAFSTRRIQQHQDPNMARNNTLARERRLMLSDMLVVLCFEAAEGDHLLHWPATSSRRTSPGSRSPATAALGAAPTGWPAWSSSSVATSTSCACACSSPPPARPTTPAKARCGVVPSIRRWQACSCRPPTRADAPTRLV
jgi:hypothetical protein